MDKMWIKTKGVILVNVLCNKTFLERRAELLKLLSTKCLIRSAIWESIKCNIVIPLVMDEMWIKAEDVNLVVAKPYGLHCITSFAEYIWEPYYLVVLYVNSNFVRRFMLTRQIPSEKSYQAVVFSFQAILRKRRRRRTLDPTCDPVSPSLVSPTPFSRPRRNSEAMISTRYGCKCTIFLFTFSWLTMAGIRSAPTNACLRGLSQNNAGRFIGRF